MKIGLLIVLLTLVGCFPAMHTGPEPHSIPYSAETFNRVSDYLTQHPEISGFVMKQVPASIPSDVRDAMQEINFYKYEVDSMYQLYYCGNGVGGAWGFLHGDLTEEEIQDSHSIKYNGFYGRISYLARLDTEWFRFATN